MSAPELSAEEALKVLAFGLGPFPKVWVVLDPDGGADALYGCFTSESLATEHAASLGPRFIVEESELLDCPMGW